MVSLLSVLDDIAATLDDVAVMSKLAIRKTSVLMSDDLAVNAGAVQGVDPTRELPVVKSIFLGSLLNKVYCISGVLVLLVTYPPIISWVMIVGGLYLSYEGVHKILEKVLGRKLSKKSAPKKFSESKKIKGAVTTDLILSIEIIVIAQGTIADQSLLTQILVLSVVGFAASVLIYGLVALIIKTDDFGLHLVNKGHEKIGGCLIRSMPYTMKGLGIIGTIAMLLVGGGIINHTLIHDFYTNESLQNLIVGLGAGLVIIALLQVAKLLFKSKSV